MKDKNLSKRKQIEEIEKILEKAKKGNLKGFIVTLDAETDLGTVLCHNIDPHILSGSVLCPFSLISKWHISSMIKVKKQIDSMLNIESS